jgi:hypothetical protein
MVPTHPYALRVVQELLTHDLLATEFRGRRKAVELEHHEIRERERMDLLGKNSLHVSQKKKRKNRKSGAKVPPEKVVRVTISFESVTSEDGPLRAGLDIVLDVSVNPAGRPYCFLELPYESNGLNLGASLAQSLDGILPACASLRFR